MTRDGTVGRFRRNRAKPGVSSGHRSRLNDEDSVRGPHQGQQSTRTAPTGRTHDCKRPLRCTPNDLLPGGVTSFFRGICVPSPWVHPMRIVLSGVAKARQTPVSPSKSASKKVRRGSKTQPPLRSRNCLAPKKILYPRDHMQNFNERDCHAKFNSQPCAQRYNSDDERNRSSSGSSSQRPLGSCSRAAFG